MATLAGRNDLDEFTYRQTSIRLQTQKRYQGPFGDVACMVLQQVACSHCTNMSFYRLLDCVLMLGAGDVIAISRFKLTRYWENALRNPRWPISHILKMLLIHLQVILKGPTLSEGDYFFLNIFLKLHLCVCVYGGGRQRCLFSPSTTWVIRLAGKHPHLLGESSWWPRRITSL